MTAAQKKKKRLRRNAWFRKKYWSDVEASRAQLRARTAAGKDREYYARHRATAIKRVKRYKRTHRETVRAQKRKQHADLRVWYLRELCRRKGVEQPPQELLDLQADVVRAHRAVKTVFRKASKL